MNYFEIASRYAGSMMRGEPALLKELRETTARELRYDDMLSGPVVGSFLNMLVRISGARSVLEIGTFTGYATLWMAAALPQDGKLVTCETNEKYALIARRFIERFRHEAAGQTHGHKSAGQTHGQKAAGQTHGHKSAGQTHGQKAAGQTHGQKAPGQTSGMVNTAKSDLPHWGSDIFNPGQSKGPEIRLCMGPALETPWPDQVDFVFLDADKEHYPDYYQRIMPRLASGGLLVVDNAFWGGKVWGSESLAETPDASVAKVSEAYDDEQKTRGRVVPADRQAAAIDRLNRVIADDAHVENVVLTVRDGLHLVRKIR